MVTDADIASAQESSVPKSTEKADGVEYETKEVLEQQ